MLTNFNPRAQINGNGWKRTAAILAAVAALTAIATRYGSVLMAAGGEVQRTSALEVRVAKLEEGQADILRSLGRIEGALGTKGKP